MQKAEEQEKILQDRRLQERLQKIRHKLIVMSGKGGVGKTTVAVNLAYELALRGKQVGILDVDMHGPNIAKMLGVEDVRLAGSEKGIEALAVLPNLKAVSMAMLLEHQDQPVIWRGPLKMATIKQFLSDVNWGSLDYLVIDSPPGTGDEPLSVCQLIPDISGAVIVTTPQDVAILDSRKSVAFAKSIGVPLVGIIENMSGFACPHCQKPIELFGEGGGREAAEDLNVPFLGQIPVNPQIVRQSDTGQPYVQLTRNDPSSCVMSKIVEKIIKHLGHDCQKI